MVVCAICGRKIKETMEGVYPGRKCASCFADESAKLGLKVGKKISERPLKVRIG